MDLDLRIENLVNKVGLSDDGISKICEQATDKILKSQLKIVDLVKRLDPVLTNPNHEVRFEGVKILVNIVMTLPTNSLIEKEIEVLNEFLCMRFIDHKIMQPLVLRSFAHFLKCEAKPPHYNKTLLDFLSSKANIQKLEPVIRLGIYNLARTIIQERSKVSANIDTDTIYSFVRMIEGESHPRNLLVCFSIVSLILKTYQNLEPYIDDLFEWLACYYPVEYTPDENDEDQSRILRSDLVDALYDCFYATPLNSDNLQTLLFEKLNSNLLSSKLESLECLIKSYEVFPYKSIEKYASTLWTAVRMDCLKKTSLIDPKLLDLSYKALYSLSKKLEAGDGDKYLSFLSDMLEELFIAFRKPEMELFEPAAKLLTQAAKPRIASFNLALSKILPVALNAIDSNELRPLPGLAFLFEGLLESQPDARLSGDLDGTLNKLASKISNIIPSNSQALRLFNALTKCKVPIDGQILDATIERLCSSYNEASSDSEMSLALICVNYKRFDILSARDEDRMDCDLESLVRFSGVATSRSAGDKKSQVMKLSIFTRLLILHLDPARSTALDSLTCDTISKLFLNLRNLANNYHDCSRLVENIGRIHAVLLNKLNDDIQPIMMQFFGSSYCQMLIPADADQRSLSSDAYLPIISWCLKSLVVRNHELSAPLINLLLNFITSDKVDLKLSLAASRCFGFVLDDEEPPFFDSQKGYRIFFLHKQKFYMQTVKEIRIRYERHEENSKKNLLLCTLASQITHLPSSVYKRDHEWLLRQLLKMLSKLDHEDCESNPETEELLYIFYSGIEALIQPGACETLLGFLNTLVELNLQHATSAKTLRVRQRALICLLNVAQSFKESDLIILRSTVLDRLRDALKDRKRLVRQAAAKARLRWSILGQSIGSS